MRIRRRLDGPNAATAQEGKDVVFSDVRLYSMARNDKYKLAVDSLTREPTELYDMDADADQIHLRYQVSIQLCFLPSRGIGSGAESSPSVSHLRVSAGSITSSTSNTVPAFNARDHA
jgi:hypothetical protein